MPPSQHSTNTTRRGSTKQKQAVRYSMCILAMFAWPLYRASIVSTTIQENKERDAFSPSNIETSVKVNCGQYKCFFRNKHSHDVGYLVAPSTRKNNADLKWFETLESGWTLAQELVEKYNIDHFLLSPPIKITISKELSKKLNKHLFSEKKQSLIRGKKATRFPRGSIAFVQKCKTAPKRNIVIGCHDSKVAIFKKNVGNFVKNIKHVDSFKSNLKKGLNQTIEILSQEPCLTRDFQVIVDERGELYHLDLDRCFDPEFGTSKYEIPPEATKSCLKALSNIESRLDRYLEKQASDQPTAEEIVR